MALVLGRISEVADERHIAPSTLHRWIKDGHLEVFTIKGHQHVVIADVDHLLERRSGGAQRGRPLGSSTRR